MNLTKLKNVCGSKIRIMDLGGSPSLRTTWEKYYTDTDAIIFVIDISSNTGTIEKLMEARAFFRYVLDDDNLKNRFVPVLIFGNKMDERNVVEDGEEEEKCNIDISADDNTRGDDGDNDGLKKGKLDGSKGVGNMKNMPLMDMADLFLSAPRGCPLLSQLPPLPSPSPSSSPSPSTSPLPSPSPSTSPPIQSSHPSTKRTTKKSSSKIVRMLSSVEEEKSINNNNNNNNNTKNVTTEKSATIMNHDDTTTAVTTKPITTEEKKIGIVQQHQHHHHQHQQQHRSSLFSSHSTSSSSSSSSHPSSSSSSNIGNRVAFSVGSAKTGEGVQSAFEWLVLGAKEIVLKNRNNIRL